MGGFINCSFFVFFRQSLLFRGVAMKNYPVFIGIILFSYNPNKAKTSTMWLYESESRKELIRQENFKIRLRRFPRLSGFCGTSGGCVRSLPASCASGLDVPRPQKTGGYCLSVADDSLCCCCWVGCSVGFFGGRRGRKKNRKEKNKQKTQKGQMETGDVVLMLAAEGAGQRCQVPS